MTTSELIPASELPGSFVLPSIYHYPVRMHAEPRHGGRVAICDGHGDVVVVLRPEQRVRVVR